MIDGALLARLREQVLIEARKKLDEIGVPAYRMLDDDVFRHTVVYVNKGLSVTIEASPTPFRVGPVLIRADLFPPASTDAFVKGPR